MSVNLIAVFLHIILTTVYYNQDMIVSAAVAAVVLEFVHTVVKFTDIFSLPSAVVYHHAFFLAPLILLKSTSIGRPV